MAANLRIKPTATKSGIWKYFDGCLDGQHAKCKLCLSAGQKVKYKIRRSNFQGIQINFAPPCPPGFANFRGAGRGKTCFFAGRGGAALFSRGGAPIPAIYFMVISFRRSKCLPRANCPDEWGDSEKGVSLRYPYP